MHILIVVAHADPASYTHAVVDQLVTAIGEAAGHTVEIADLIAEGFDPRFSAEDLAVFRGQATHGPAIRAEQQRIDRADVMVLAYPVYWWSMPAVLKGWIDRVFTAGWAFDEDPAAGIVPRLGRLTAHAIAVAGADRGTYDRRGYLNAMIKQTGEGVFDFCGIRSTRFDLLHTGDEEQAKAGLIHAMAIGRRLVEPDAG